jgi:hypothetical protein
MISETWNLWSVWCICNLKSYSNKMLYNITWQLSFISLYNHIPEISAFYISVHLLLQIVVTVHSFKAHQPYNQMQRTQTCLCDVELHCTLWPARCQPNEMKPE